MEHKTGLEDAYVMKDNKRLRMGYTTGSCAAAAAKAAASMLLCGSSIEETALMTPKGILLHLLIEDIKIKTDDNNTPIQVSCAVRKDGGDDPDVTDQALVYATVTRQDEGITIDGGEGVGRVTKPGLARAVGEAAINPVPLQMITHEVQDICREYGYHAGLKVVISIPRGRELADKTFNPRLGIEGGISVLGTSGIVIPMSEDALIASIRLEMQTYAARGEKYLLVTPGNYGERFASQMKELDHSTQMKCSNYVGETIDMAVELGFKGVLFIAHIGKFIKVSGGIMNTHSHSADCRAELMAAACIRAGGDADTAHKVLDTFTTEEALDVLEKSGAQLVCKTMEQVCLRVEFYLKNRCKGRIQIGAVLFSQVRGKLGETSEVPSLINYLNNEREE